MSARFTWRKLSAAKWEDVWWDRLSEVSDRLGDHGAGRREDDPARSVSLQRARRRSCERAFGGQIAAQKKAAVLPAQAPRAPIRVRGKLVVVATEHERARGSRKAGGRRSCCSFPAGMAFGTGDHATTSTCLRFLADVSDELARTSRGRCSISAPAAASSRSRRGCSARARVDAGDFDPRLPCARREGERAAERHRGVTVKKLDVRKWQPPRTWPVVAANLFSGLLIEVAPKIAAATAPGGRLIFSGILREQEAEVVAAFQRAGFRIDRVVRKGKWVSGLATLKR